MTVPDHKIWDDILSHLRRHHVGVCRKWFDELEFLGIDRGALLLRVDQPARRRYLETDCAPFFAEAAQALTGMLLTVRFLRPGDHTPSSNGSHHAPAPRPAAPITLDTTDDDIDDVEPVLPRTLDAAPPAPLPLPTQSAPASAMHAAESLRISPDFTFDNFVTGPENRLAHAAALAVAENPGRAYNPLFIHGRVGLGKSHLLQAICHRICDRNPNASIHYTSCEGFLTQFVEAVTSNQMPGFRHRFRDADVLVIDDIHFLAKHDRVQEEFFHTFNSLFQAQKQIVLSSDAPPDLIPSLEERLVSRFKWGLVAEVEKPSYDTRIAIVQKKAELRGLNIPHDVAALIAASIDANIRELEGAVVRLQAQANIENVDLNLDLAQRVLSQIPSKAPLKVSINVIMDTVAEFYSLKLSDLQSKRRQKSIAQPRQLCMFLARRLTDHSLEEIGNYFGGRDHTTVMHAVRTTAERMEADSDYAAVVTTLQQRAQIPKPATQR